MRVLDVEIDTDFIYFVGPIKVSEQRKDAYRMFFELKFKDGRSHEVQIDNNFRLVPWRGDYLVMNKKHLTKFQQKRLEIRKPKDLQTLNDLRAKIIEAKK